MHSLPDEKRREALSRAGRSGALGRWADSIDWLEWLVIEITGKEMQDDEVT